MQKLENDLKKFMQDCSDSGIELTFNLIDFAGVVADAVYNPENKLFAYKLLAPIDAMVQDRVHILNVKQYLYQKKERRLTIHSDGDNIYIFRVIETDSGFFVHNTYRLDKENFKLLHDMLENSVVE